MTKRKELPRYTVQRVTGDNKLFGSIHWSERGRRTLCAKNLTGDWYILSNASNGRADCPECKAIWEERG